MQCSFVDKPIYFYDHREGSATTSVNQYVFDTVTVYQEIHCNGQERISKIATGIE